MLLWLYSFVMLIFLLIMLPLVQFFFCFCFCFFLFSFLVSLLGYFVMQTDLEGTFKSLSSINDQIIKKKNTKNTND